MLVVSDETTVDGTTGGMIAITGGLGSSESVQDRGNGGPIYITGGEALGKNVLTDAGGKVRLQGSQALTSSGGKMEFFSGYGRSSSSGSIAIDTANADTKGVSELLA